MAGKHGHHTDEREPDRERHDAHDELGRARRLDEDEDRRESEDQDRDPERSAQELGVRQPTPRSSAAGRRSR